MRAPRSLLLAAVGALTASAVVVAAPPTTGPVAAAPGTASEVVALVVEGVGNGHGRGMSQWGAYGRAVNGQSWQQILDTYYGGTTLADATAADHAPAAAGRITVRLVGLDGLATTGVISAGGTARWNGNGAWRSLHASHVSGDLYRIYGSTAAACPGGLALTVPDGPVVRGDTGDDVRRVQQFLSNFGFEPGPVDGIFGAMTEAAVQRFQNSASLPATGQWRTAEANAARAQIAASGSVGSWQDLGTASGPVVFSTPVDESTAAPGDVLGVCGRDGTVTHYRGTVVARRDGNGALRTVNEVSMDAYLRGVVPREMSASWGSAAGGAGMNALRAQAVAARSYALAQNRYSYAKTCDTTACQAYGGAARRSSPSGAVEVREHPNTDAAVRETTGKIRRRSNGAVASTEYSASNGPRTAGGVFPAIDDPFDDVPANPNHRWTRVIPASSVTSRYGLGSLTAATTETDPSLVSQNFSGIWSNRVRLSGSSVITVSAWDFRGAFGLPSPGYTIRAVTRDLVSTSSFALIGDSISAGVTGSATAILPSMLSGVFAATRYDAVSGRNTVGSRPGITDGLQAAAAVPMGTNLVVVQLGYNDPENYAGKIDQMMNALRARGVGTVAWLNLSERRTDRGHAGVNSALNAARSRWPELSVLDWNAASTGAARNRWFASDQIHLTVTGRAEFTRFVRDQVLVTATGQQPPATPPTTPPPVTTPPTTTPPTTPAVGSPVTAGGTLRVPVAGRGGVPTTGATAVALTVTAVSPRGPGYLTVWPCGSPMPVASNVNYAAGAGAEPGSVLVQLDGTGEVCVFSQATAHVLVDVAGWFAAGFQPVVPTRVVDTRSGIGAEVGRVQPGTPLRVPLGAGGGSAVALTVTAVDPLQAGYLTVWPCGSPMPVASNVNYGGGPGARPNLVLTPLDGTGEVCIHSHAPAHVLVDLAGRFTGGFQPIVPQRVVDTRIGQGTAAPGRVQPSSPLRVELGSSGLLPPTGVVAVALNVTAVDPMLAGYLTVWPCGSPMPVASNVNYPAGTGASPNAVLVQLDQTGAVCVYSSAAAHVLVDLAGSLSSEFRPVVPNRIVDTRQP